jgi:DNA-binding transcriptional LysR family regulator
MHIRPAIELRHLFYFLAVAEELGFSRAAARIGIAQPPLSQQIHRLEELLGCRLFDRSARQVRLTGAGATLVPEARRILTDVSQLTALMRMAGRGEVGTLTIGFASSTLFSPLPAAVRRFRERFPRVRVRLREIEPPRHAEALRAGTVDVALSREPLPASGVATLPVLVEPFLAALPGDHPLARRRRLAVAALRDEPFVLFPRAVAPGLYQQLARIFRQGGFDPRVVQEADEWQTILSLVEAGIGITLIPASLRGQRAGALAFPALAGVSIRTTTAACYREPESAHAVQAFLSVLREGG